MATPVRYATPRQWKLLKDYILAAIVEANDDPRIQRALAARVDQGYCRVLAKFDHGPLGLAEAMSLCIAVEVHTGREWHELCEIDWSLLELTPDDCYDMLADTLDQRERGVAPKADDPLERRICPWPDPDLN